MLGEKEEDVVKAIKKYEKEGVIGADITRSSTGERTEVPPRPPPSSSRGLPQEATPALTRLPAG